MTRATAGEVYTLDGSPPLFVDREAYLVTMNEQAVRLTARQLDILLFLIGNRHRVVTTVEIAQSVFNARHGNVGLIVRVHVCQMRRELGAPYIETVRGRGYRFIGMCADDRVPAAGSSTQRFSLSPSAANGLLNGVLGREGARGASAGRRG